MSVPVDRITKSTSRPFPVIRKSSDHLRPESGEIEFSQLVAEADEAQRQEVQGAQEALGTTVQEDARRKNSSQSSKRETSSEEEQEGSTEKAEEKVSKTIDIEV